jgi:hypothetical protein
MAPESSSSILFGSLAEAYRRGRIAADRVPTLYESENENARSRVNEQARLEDVR